MSGHAELEAFIASVEALRETNEKVAAAAEKDVGDALRADLNAGRGPDGAAWPELDGGGRALEGAAAALTTETKGARIIFRIGKPWVFHHHGAGGTSTSKDAVRSRARSASKHAKGGTSSKFHAPRRQILPTFGERIPPKMAAAIQKAAARFFQKAVG